MEESLVKFHEERRASAGGRRTRSLPNKSWPWLKVTSESSNKYTFPQVKPSNLLYETTASLACKLPMIPALEKVVALSTTKLGTKRYQTPHGAAFDLTDPFRSPPEYSVLHDPHLKEYFNNPITKAELKEKGFITKDGYVKCSIAEFNHYRTWIRKLKLDALDREKRHNEAQEAEERKQRVSSKGTLRDGSHEIIKARQERARQVMQEKREKSEEEKRRYLKLQERDQQRIEQFKKKKEREKAVKDQQKNLNRERRKSCHTQESMKDKKIRIKFFNQKAKEEELRRKQIERHKKEARECQDKKAEEQWMRRQSQCMKAMEDEMVARRWQTEKRRQSIQAREDNYAAARRKSETLLKTYMQTNHEAAIKHLQEADKFLSRIDEKKKQHLEQLREKSRRHHEREENANTKQVNITTCSRGRSSGPRKSVWDVDQCVIMDLQEMHAMDERKPSTITEEVDDSSQKDVDEVESKQSHPEKVVTHEDADKSFLTDKTERELLSSLSRQMINNVLFDAAVSLGYEEGVAKDHLDLSPSWQMEDDITVSSDLIDQATIIISAAIDNATATFGFVANNEDSFTQEADIEELAPNRIVLETEEGDCMTVSAFVEQTVQNAMDSLVEGVDQNIQRQDPIPPSAATTANTKRLSLAHQPLSHKLSKICLDNHLEDFDSYTSLTMERVASEGVLEDYLQLQARPGSMCATESSLQIENTMSHTEIANKIVAATLTNSVAEVIAWQTIEAAIEENERSEDIRTGSFVQEEAWKPMRQKAELPDDSDSVPDATKDHGSTRRVSVMFDEGSLTTAVKAVAEVPRTARRASIATRLPTPKTSFTDREAIETSIEEENEAIEVNVNHDNEIKNDYPRESDFLETARRLTPYFPPSVQKCILKDLKGRSTSSNPILNSFAEESDSEYPATPGSISSPSMSTHKGQKTRCRSARATNRKKSEKCKGSESRLSSSSTGMKRFFDAVRNEVENILVTDNATPKTLRTDKNSENNKERKIDVNANTTAGHLRLKVDMDGRRAVSESKITAQNDRSPPYTSRNVKSLQDIDRSTAKEANVMQSSEYEVEEEPFTTNTTESHDTAQAIETEGSDIGSPKESDTKNNLNTASSQHSSEETANGEHELSSQLSVVHTEIEANLTLTPKPDESLSKTNATSPAAPLVKEGSSKQSITSRQPSLKSIKSNLSMNDSSSSIGLPHASTEQGITQSSSPAGSTASTSSNRDSKHNQVNVMPSEKSKEGISETLSPLSKSALSIKSTTKSHSTIRVSRSDSYTMQNKEIRGRKKLDSSEGFATKSKTPSISQLSISRSQGSVKSPVRSQSSLRSSRSINSSTSVKSPRNSRSKLIGRPSLTSQSTEAVVAKRSSSVISKASSKDSETSQRLLIHSNTSLRSSKAVSKSESLNLGKTSSSSIRTSHLDEAVEAAQSTEKDAIDSKDILESNQVSGERLSSSGSIISKTELQSAKPSNECVDERQQALENDGNCNVIDLPTTPSTSQTHSKEEVNIDKQTSNEETILNTDECINTTGDGLNKVATESITNISNDQVNNSSFENEQHSDVVGTAQVQHEQSATLESTSQQGSESNALIQQSVMTTTGGLEDNIREKNQELLTAISSTQLEPPIEDQPYSNMEVGRTSATDVNPEADKIVIDCQSNQQMPAEHNSSNGSLTNLDLAMKEVEVQPNNERESENVNPNTSAAGLDSVTEEEAKDGRNNLPVSLEQTSSYVSTTGLDVASGEDTAVEQNNPQVSTVEMGLNASNTELESATNEVRVEQTNSEVSADSTIFKASEVELNEGDKEAKTISEKDIKGSANENQDYSVQTEKADEKDSDERQPDHPSIHNESKQLTSGTSLDDSVDLTVDAKEEAVVKENETEQEGEIRDNGLHDDGGSADSSIIQPDSTKIDGQSDELCLPDVAAADPGLSEIKGEEVILYSEAMDVDLACDDEKKQVDDEPGDKISVSRSVTTFEHKEGNLSTSKTGSRRSASSPEIPVAVNKAHSNVRQVRSNCVLERRTSGDGHDTRSMKALSVSRKESAIMGKPTRSIHSNHSRTSSISQTKQDTEQLTQEELPSPRSHTSVDCSPRPNESHQIFVTPVASAVDFTTSNRGSSASTVEIKAENDIGSLTKLSPR